MEKTWTWYELSLLMGLEVTVNEYIAMNGDIDKNELMDIFNVDETKAIEVISKLQY
jgi:hypothetical protein